MTTIDDDLVPAPRRRDAVATRLALLEAARSVLNRRGGGSTREIAAAAGVNQALVYRYFGSKEKLLAEAVRSTYSAAELVMLRDAPLADLPRLLLDRMPVGGGGRDDQPTVSAAVIGEEHVRESIREQIDTGFGEVLAARLDGQDAVLRAELVAAVLAGVALLRDRIGAHGLLDADPAALQAQVERLTAVLLQPASGDRPIR
jgi:AcrR family transcriptional regulator